jgi:hypothetical protein
MQLDRRRTVLGIGATLIALIAFAAVAAGAVVDVPAGTTTPDPGVTKTVLVVGDSVPKSFVNEFADVAAKRGYAVVGAAHGGCPATGVGKVFSSGKRWKNACLDVVSKQDADVEKYRPALVIWWSRYELAPRLGPDGKALPLGSRAYVHEQEASFDQRVRALTRLGARLVTVQVEPPGPDLAVRNPPERYFLVGQTLLHRSDVVNGWNAFLARHKGPKVFSISIDHLVCHDTRVPCNDRLPDGQPARPDGVHYSEAAQRLFAPQIFDEALRAAQLDTVPAS